MPAHPARPASMEFEPVALETYLRASHPPRPFKPIESSVMPIADKHNPNVGGRLAANFRSGTIAEVFAANMMQAFAAIAPIPRHEDYGLDLVGTLLNRTGKVYLAENSFVAQVKIRSSANFLYKGQGLRWLRNLELPYFPVIADLRKATLSIHTINFHRKAFLPGVLVDEINFTLDGDGFDDFPLGDPLLVWTMEDAAHPDFPAWAYSILKPAVEIEAWNHRFAEAGFVRDLLYGETQFFQDRGPDGSPREVPRAGELTHFTFPDQKFLSDNLGPTLFAFGQLLCQRARNTQQLDDLLVIRDAFRRLGVEPDPENSWEDRVSYIREYWKRATQPAD